MIGYGQFARWASTRRAATARAVAACVLSACALLLAFASSAGAYGTVEEGWHEFTPPYATFGPYYLSEMSRLGSVQEVAGGFGFSVLRLSDGKVFERAELPDEGEPHATAYEVPLPEAASQIAVGEDHALALLASGKIYAWGDNQLGELGNDTYDATGEAIQTTPVEVDLANLPAGETVVEVAAHYWTANSFWSDSMLRTRKGEVYAWGANDGCFLGGFECGSSNGGPEKCDVTGGFYPGDYACSTLPVRVPDLPDGVEQIAAGGSVNLALFKHDIYEWGEPSIGGAKQPQPTVVQGMGNENVVEIAVGNYRFARLKGSGEIVTWGNRGEGQPNGGPPVTVSGVGPNVSKLSTGAGYSLALEDGKVFQLEALEGPAPLATPLSGVGEATAIGTGRNNFLIVRSNKDETGLATSSGSYAGQVEVSAPPGTTVSASSTSPIDWTGAGEALVGDLSFTIKNVNDSVDHGCVDVQLALPANAPSITKLWKIENGSYTEYPASISPYSNTATIELCDGQYPGDQDDPGVQNGEIVDPIVLVHEPNPLAPPEIGRCEKTASLVKGGKGRTGKLADGAYMNSGCTTKSATKTGGYEWRPGFLEAGFSGTGGAGVLETVAGAKTTCRASATHGRYVGDTAERETIRFTGCESSGHECATPGLSEGEIETSELDGTLGWEKKASKKAALDLRPAGSEPVMEYRCGGAITVVSGSVLAPVKSDKMSKTATLKFKATKGKQKPDAFEGAQPDVLSSSLNEGSPEPVGLTLTTVETSEEALEVNGVV